MFLLKRVGIVVLILVALAGGTLSARWVFGLTHQTKQAASDLDPSAPGSFSPQDLTTENIIRNLQSYLQTHPVDSVAYGNLGIYYLQRARETGDPAYYPKAEGVLNKALQLDPNDFRALIGIGSLALSRHQFREALVWGERAQPLNPYNASIYAIIGDAQIELGDYTAAFQTFEQMTSLRPDLTSYSRISYARELKGDLPGAVQAMQQAVQAGAPNSEGVNWARVQLGNLYFNQGDYADAEQTYQAALNFFPDYPYAQAGIANVRAAQGDYATAISLYAHVVKVMPLPQFVIALGDIDTAAGRTDEAQQQYSLVDAEEKLFAANGVDVDAELALFDADHNRNLPQALEQARAAYARRPSITVADVLAWTLYKSGDGAAAQQAMQEALKLGTRNPLMFYHAGMIAYQTGDYADASDYLKQALALNPQFSILYAGQAKQTLADLQSKNLMTGVNH